MSIGSWLLVVFSAVSLLACYAWLSEEQRDHLFAKLPKGLQKHNHDLSRFRRKLALAGAPLSVGVGIYTGVLLGAVQSRPFWNTNLVAQMFLFSALSTGSAALIFALALRRCTDMHAYRLLYAFDIIFMSLEFFIILPYLIHGQLSVQPVQDALQLILGGPFTVLFWLCFLGCGLLLPLAIELGEFVPALIAGEIGHYNGKLAGTTSLLVLAGGFLLRYIFVYAGQISAFH
jgi:formate-dependent nitrite reductase membrane component NrfD